MTGEYAPRFYTLLLTSPKSGQVGGAEGRHEPPIRQRLDHQGPARERGVVHEPRSFPLWVKDEGENALRHLPKRMKRMKKLAEENKMADVRGEGNAPKRGGPSRLDLIRLFGACVTLRSVEQRLLDRTRNLDRNEPGGGVQVVLSALINNA